MTQQFKGKISVDIKDLVADWDPFIQDAAPDCAPNVVYVVLDDVGFAAMEPYGGLIETPNINRLASGAEVHEFSYDGVVLADAVVSDDRAQPHHQRDGGDHRDHRWVPERQRPHPAGVREYRRGPGRARLEHLRGRQAAPDRRRRDQPCRVQEQWPLGRGLERFYGFSGGETSQWFPNLIYDNHPVARPSTPDEGYHLTVDLTDRALEFIHDAKAIAPDKPFFLYFCPGAAHAPHHAPKEWIEKYRGKFDMGYEVLRETIFERQKQLGVIPPETELSSINPYTETTGPHGQPWPQSDTVRPWGSLSDDEQRLFARMAEVYAGFLAHADHEIGRLLDDLEASGELENTIVVLVFDNGASGEGGPNGSVNENKFFNGIPDSIEENLKYIDDLGSPRTFNHYALGWAWAFNTPFKLWKRYGNYRGGTADPLIVSWPARLGASGGVRTQYNHAIDIVPTLYELLGIELPESIDGHVQKPLEGVSFAATIDDPDADTGKTTQFFSMLGTRAIWHQGWKAATAVPASPDYWSSFDEQRWELFDTTSDPSECHDLAEQEPDKWVKGTS